jgi:hypothetical protein
VDATASTNSGFGPTLPFNLLATMINVPYLALTASLFELTVAAPSHTVDRVDEFVRHDAPAPPFMKRAASCTFPTPPKTSSLSAPITVSGTFDGLLGFLRCMR